MDFKQLIIKQKKDMNNLLTNTSSLVIILEENFVERLDAHTAFILSVIMSTKDQVNRDECYITTSDIEKITGLTYKQQIPVIKKLEKNNLLQSLLQGRQKYFKLNLEAIEYIKNNKGGTTSPQDKINTTLNKIEETISDHGGAVKLTLKKQESDKLLARICKIFKDAYPLDLKNATSYSDMQLRSRLINVIQVAGDTHTLDLIQYSLQQNTNIEDQYRISVTNPYDFVEKYNKILDKKLRTSITDAPKTTKIFNC